MVDVRVGTCGYRYYDPGENRQDEYENTLAAYSDAFPAGELNRTFYDLPQVSTAERWRREAVEDFEFALKAWQGVTHPWSSPTWNDHRDGVDDVDTDDLGLLQPTDAVRDAWVETRRRTVALEAEVVVLQTPPSFDCTDAHEADMRELLSTIDRGDLTLAWEPRGDWPDHPDRIRQICTDLDLVHVVDPMRADPRHDHGVCYTRLHGLTEDLHDYDYEYGDAELDELADRLQGCAEDHDRVYCMFNNFAMYDDARALLERLPDGP